MKTIKFFVATMFLLLSGISGNLFALDDNIGAHTVKLGAGEAALLDVIGTVELTFGGGATIAGQEVSTESEANTNSRIRISSLLSDGQTRRIDVTIDKDPKVTSNCLLEVQALAPNATFQNTVAPVAPVNAYGTLKGIIDLTSASGVTAQTLVDDIYGVCWTGTGTDDGYVLSYTLSQGDNTLAFIAEEYLVTYTLSDNF